MATGSSNVRNVFLYYLLLSVYDYRSDIKSANIFLFHDHSVKLGDFGLSRVLDVGVSRMSSSLKQAAAKSNAKDQQQHSGRRCTIRSKSTCHTMKESPSYRNPQSAFAFKANQSVTFHVPSSLDRRAMSQAGTDCYMAPEVHKEEDYGKSVRAQRHSPYSVIVCCHPSLIPYRIC